MFLYISEYVSYYYAQMLRTVAAIRTWIGQDESLLRARARAMPPISENTPRGGIGGVTHKVLPIREDK
jgi:hypothetical protein